VGARTLLVTRHYTREAAGILHNNTRRSVFQGLRRDVYEAGLLPEPFSHSLLEKPKEINTGHSIALVFCIS
jgi:hypothetical protein